MGGALRGWEHRSTRFDCRREATRTARDVDGKVVRITSYSAAETAARRAVIEAAKMWRWNPSDLPSRALWAAVDALEALERKADGPTVTLTGEQATKVRLVGKSKRKEAKK